MILANGYCLTHECEGIGWWALVIVGVTILAIAIEAWRNR